MCGVLAEAADEIVVIGSLPIHKICRDKTYMRSIITQTKAVPLMSMSLCASWIDSQDKVMTYAKKVVYPYFLVLGEKDVIVSNVANREWHSKTSTPAKHKDMKLMAGSYHELAKEPNRTTLYESVLKFMQTRLADTEKPSVPFGMFDPKKEMKVA